MTEHKNLMTHLSEWWETRKAATIKTDRNWSRWLPTPGNVIFTLLVIGALIVTQKVWARSAQSVFNAANASTSEINYQGRLANSDGSPVPDGNYAMSFSLYDALEDGTLLWGPEIHGTVPVSGGLFSVGLAIPIDKWTGENRYLEITVDNEKLEPRELIRSVPVAGLALTVPDGAIGASQIADGAVTGPKLSRQLTVLSLPNNVSMPTNRTWYDVLSHTINPEQDTLVTIHASISPQNNAGDTLMRAEILVDGNPVSPSVDSYSKQGIGETLGLSTSLLLSSGPHEIKLRAYSWANDSYVNGNDRTQLIIVEE